jgi:glycosyltransferase involved in cell wall biosynthesis
MVLVSVLLGSYNHEKYLAEAIESVLNQTCPELELIIIDDCSSDNSKALIEGYQAKDSRVKAFFHEKNMGIAITVNEGLKAARGDFISFIGSDDVWFPYKLERQLALAKVHKELILWSEGEIIDSDSKPTGKTFSQLHNATHKKKNGNLFESIVEDNYIFGQSLLINKNFLSGILFDPTLRYLNDYRFMAELANKHEFLFSTEPMAKYRIHPKNTISNDRSGWLKDRIVLNNYFLQRYCGEISRSLKGILYAQVGRSYDSLGEKEVAKRFYLKAISTDPFSKETILYLGLALSGAKSFLGNSLLLFYFKLSSALTFKNT